MGTSPRDLIGKGFEGLLGLRITELADDFVSGELAVREELKQPFGLVHGGVFASIAESLASVATVVAVADEGRIAMGQANQTSFLRPVTGGTIHASARARHRGRNSWVWDVEVSDDDGRLCALSRMTIAVRDR